jgi:hypothetical protein
MGAERRGAEAKHKQTQATQDTHTRQAPGTPNQVSQGDRPKGNRENLRPTEPEPERQREQKPRPRKTTATNRVAPKVTFTSEWRDLSAVEGPSKGGLRASEHLSDRRLRREAQDATATHLIPFRSSSSFSWACLLAGMRRTARRAS